MESGLAAALEPGRGRLRTAAVTAGWKIRILLALAAVAAAIVLLLPPIPQDPAYHRFADQRTWLGLPNAANVLSNLPFLLVGGLGLRELAAGSPPGLVPEFRVGYAVFFAGIAAIGLGSGYYHLHPNNDSLVWDRLAMTIPFMAFVAVVVAEQVSVAAARRLLWPLECVGVLAVLYWHLSEGAGRGDLRWYGLVQFLPMLLVPLMLLWFPSRLSGRGGYLWALLAGYALAKAAELWDAEIFQALGGLSGHSLKHLLSAAAAACLWLAIRRRRLRDRDRSGVFRGSGRD